MRRSVLLFLFTFITLLFTQTFAHGGCESDSECTDIEDGPECCSFISYNEAGQFIKTNNFCYSISQMSVIFSAYKTRVGASNVTI